MEKVNIRIGGEYGEAREYEVHVQADGEIRLVEPGGDPVEDAMYVGTDWEDLASQITYDGNVLERDILADQKDLYFGES